MKRLSLLCALLAVSAAALFGPVGPRLAVAAHANSAPSHYSYCVSGRPGSWAITAYIAPQAGMACYASAEAAINSLPASVTSIGSTNAAACQATLPPSAPPGAVSFTRCGAGNTMAIAINNPTASTASLSKNATIAASSRVHEPSTRQEMLSRQLRIRKERLVRAFA
ncbi:MAG: hypothetical protein ACRDFX_11260 [Chloroflexota bacterium]